MSETVTVSVGVLDESTPELTVEFRSSGFLMQRVDLPPYLNGEAAMEEAGPEMWDNPELRKALDNFSTLLQGDRQSNLLLDGVIEVGIGEVLKAYRKLPASFRKSEDNLCSFSFVMDALDLNPKMWNMDELQVLIIDYADRTMGPRALLLNKNVPVGSFSMRGNQDDIDFAMMFDKEYEWNLLFLFKNQPQTPYEVGLGHVFHSEESENEADSAMLFIAKQAGEYLSQGRELSCRDMLANFINVNPTWISDIATCSYEVFHGNS